MSGKAGNPNWVRGKSGNPETMLKPGHPYRWQPGQTGNPRGITKMQARFRDAYIAALAGGSADNDEEILRRAKGLAAIAWQAASKGEPWAFQEIRAQLAPLITAAAVKITHEGGGDDGFDATGLTDAELEQLIELVGRATGNPGREVLGLASGEVPAGSEGLHPDGVADHRAE